MSFCLKLSSAVFCCLVTVVGVTDAAPRVRSVVRADSRTGRLVRTVIVSPRLMQAVAASGNAAAASPDASVTEIVEATARRYDVDPLLVHSVIQVESSYNPYAISPKGAQGLMQLMPGTARRFGVANAFDVQDNIEGGVRYLKYLQSIFPQDLRLAVAAYNAGEGAVWKYNNQIPPYRETEEYVHKVSRTYGKAKSAADRQRASETPARTAEVAPEGPVYAAVEHFVDGEGRLHLRTAPSGSTP